MNKTTVGLALLVLLSIGCAQPSVSKSSTTNPSVPVELLFEHDGCKIYRFYDNGYAIYYTQCGGYSSSTEWEQPEGKVSRPVQVPTYRE